MAGAAVAIVFLPLSPPVARRGHDPCARGRRRVPRVGLRARQPQRALLFDLPSDEPRRENRTRRPAAGRTVAGRARNRRGSPSRWCRARKAPAAPFASGRRRRAAGQCPVDVYSASRRGRHRRWACAPSPARRPRARPRARPETPACSLRRSRRSAGCRAHDLADGLHRALCRCGNDVRSSLRGDCVPNRAASRMTRRRPAGSVALAAARRVHDGARRAASDRPGDEHDRDGDHRQIARRRGLRSALLGPRRLLACRVRERLRLQPRARARPGRASGRSGPATPCIISRRSPVVARTSCCARGPQLCERRDDDAGGRAARARSESGRRRPERRSAGLSRSLPDEPACGDRPDRECRPACRDRPHRCPRGRRRGRGVRGERVRNRERRVHAFVALRLVDAGRAARADCIAFIRRALPLGFVSIMASVYFTVDLVLLGWLVSGSDLGYYAAATKVLSLLVVVPLMLMSAALPAVASSVPDPQALRALAIRLLHWLAAVGLPACVGAAIFARPLVRVAFGPGFDAAVPLVRILSVAAAITLLSNLLGTLLIARSIVRPMLLQNGAASGVQRDRKRASRAPLRRNRVSVADGGDRTDRLRRRASASCAGVSASAPWPASVRDPLVAVVGLAATGLALGSWPILGVPAAIGVFLVLLVTLGAWPVELQPFRRREGGS